MKAREHHGLDRLDAEFRRLCSWCAGPDRYQLHRQGPRLVRAGAADGAVIAVAVLCMVLIDHAVPGTERVAGQPVCKA
jgi:hypothetical protein